MTGAPRGDTRELHPAYHQARGWPERWCSRCLKVRYPLNQTLAGLRCERCEREDQRDTIPPRPCTSCGLMSTELYVTSLPGLRCVRCTRETPTLRTK